MSGFFCCTQGKREKLKVETFVKKLFGGEGLSEGKGFSKKCEFYPAGLLQIFLNVCGLGAPDSLYRELFGNCLQKFFLRVGCLGAFVKREKENEREFEGSLLESRSE